MIGVFVNSIVLTVILAVIMRKKSNLSSSNLLGLPLGLSILTLVASLLINDFHLVIIFVPLFLYGLLLNVRYGYQL